MRTQGKPFSHEEILRIVRLLRETEMSLPDIAGRMSCSRSGIAAINRRFQIRKYQGHKKIWLLVSEKVEIDHATSI